MPKWSGPPIQTKGDQTNIHIMLAICTAQMRRFGATVEEQQKLRDDIKHCGSFEKACDLIREWFPLDIDLKILNLCPYSKCQYPGCPPSCEGRKLVRVKPRINHNGSSSRHKLK